MSRKNVYHIPSMVCMGKTFSYFQVALWTWHMMTHIFAHSNKFQTFHSWGAIVVAENKSWFHTKTWTNVIKRGLKRMAPFFVSWILFHWHATELRNSQIITDKNLYLPSWRGFVFLWQLCWFELYKPLISPIMSLTNKLLLNSKIKRYKQTHFILLVDKNANCGLRSR